MSSSSSEKNGFLIIRRVSETVCNVAAFQRHAAANVNQLRFGKYDLDHIAEDE
jgi:hypothetical protein